MLFNTSKIENILYKQVIDDIQYYQNLVLAFSGGIDSTVLLDILYTIKNSTNLKKFKISRSFTLRAIHIHHGLNNNADDWAQHCFKECKKRNVQLNIIYINCNKNKNNGIEATARQIRYQYLFNNLSQNEILLTAQHLDDQVETFLLALKRGSGPTGLSGMPKKKFFYKYQLLRPLLQCTKEQIIKYAHNKQLIWITDDSNTETRFDRNFLRLNILPRMKARWPKINYTIARSAQLCSEQEQLLNELLKEELKKLYHYDDSLLLQPLINMSIQKRQALIRRWIFSFNIDMPSYKKLHHIWKNVVLSKKDAIPMIQLNKKFLIRRFQNRLYIVSILTQTSSNSTIKWNNFNKKISLPNKLGTLISKKLSNKNTQFLNKKRLYSQIISSKKNFLNNFYTHISNKILGLSIIRTPREKETISIKFEYSYHNNIYVIGKTHSKKVKKIWQEFKIPPWIRKKIPLVFYNDKLITALGIFITQDGDIQTLDKILKIYWLQEEKNTQSNESLLFCKKYKNF